MPDEKSQSGGLLGNLLSAVKLEWIRPLLYNLGGRKVAVPGGAVAAIMALVTMWTNQGIDLGWPHAFICGAIGLPAAVSAFSVAYEDANTMVEEVEE